jgi:tetratricopeptide (TPR) repeat protein
LSAIQRVLIAGRALWFYAAKLIWPARLTFSYARWDVSASRATLYLFPAAWFTFLAALWRLRHRIGRGAGAALVIFSGVLLPALGFVNTFPMRYSFVADHFQYAAGAALIALIVAAAFRVAPRLAMPSSLVIACVCAMLTWRQAHVYQDPETLWRDTIAKNPQSWMAQNNLAAMLSIAADADRAAGRAAEADRKLREADVLFAQADVLRPQHEMLPFSWGEVLYKLGRPDDAITQYERYIDRTRVNANTRLNVAIAHDRIGEALQALNRRAAAAERFETATRVDPSAASPWLHLAAVRDQQGRADDAIRAYQQYVRLVPDDARALTWLGLLYGNVGRFSDAAAAFTAALEIDPNLADAKRGLAMALAVQHGAATQTTRPASGP